VSETLFDEVRVGCFCDAITHSLEKRRGEEVKILTLTLRVAPFDATLATVMPDGIKPTLFTMHSGQPKDTLRRADFALGLERQLLQVFAAPDIAQGFALDQVKIAGTYARVQKDRNGYDFVFKASFGPVGSKELEFCQSWLLTQRFVTFERAEPSLDFEEADDEEADDLTAGSETARQASPRLPEWDDADEKPAAAKAESEAQEPARRMARRHSDPKKAAKAKQAKGRGAKQR
jgi:hypothetical protein